MAMRKHRREVLGTKLTYLKYSTTRKRQVNNINIAQEFFSMFEYLEQVLEHGS